jgi:DNA-binding GntR family transcriptional regulator
VTVEQKGDGKYCNYYVFDMSENDIEDLFQVRKAIESASAYLCAQRNWRVDIGELGRLAEQVQKGLRDVVDGHPSNSGVKTMELDRGFHNILVRDCGNPHFMEMYDSLGKLLDYLSLRTNEFLAVERDEDKLMLLGSQHIAIYKAVKNGYPRLASDTMNEHIDLCSNSCLRNRNLVSKRVMGIRQDCQRLDQNFFGQGAFFCAFFRQFLPQFLIIGKKTFGSRRDLSFFCQSEFALFRA